MSNNVELKSQVEVITPEIAREYLKFNVHNRPLSRAAVNKYAKEMINGDWRLNGEAICFERGGGLVNGQHRLHAVIQSCVPLTTLVVRNCEVKSFHTYNQGKKRTMSDIFSIEKIPNYRMAISTVFKYFTFHFGHLALSSELTHCAVSVKKDKNLTREELLTEYYTTPELYQTAIALGSRCEKKLKILGRVEITGLYVFLAKDKKHSESKIEHFFEMLVCEENNTMEVIRYFRDKVIKDKLSANKMTASYKQLLLTKTWNAYILQKDISRLRCNEETTIQFI